MRSRWSSTALDRQRGRTRTCDREVFVNEQLRGGQSDRADHRSHVESDRRVSAGVSNRLTQTAGATVEVVGDDRVRRAAALHREVRSARDETVSSNDERQHRNESD